MHISLLHNRIMSDLQYSHKKVDTIPSNGSASHNARIEPIDGLLQTCRNLRQRVMTFLGEDHTNEKTLRSLQGHVRVAIEVIEEAFSRYG